MCDRGRHSPQSPDQSTIVMVTLVTDALIAYRYSVSKLMIYSFGDKPTEALFRDDVVRQFQGFARPAKRKLEAINAASRLEDLKVPPANRLEKLRGHLKNFYSIRINDQWRVTFRWIDGQAHDVYRDYQQSTAHHGRHGAPTELILWQQFGVLAEPSNTLRPQGGATQSQG
jgi:toxin HigB-1